MHELEHRGYTRIVGKLGKEPDLTNPTQVDAFFTRASPEYVFLTAGKSGGIEANQKYPAELMLDNLLIECNVIHNAYCHGVKKLLYLASSCSYPKNCSQPLKEDSLLSGPLEPTNEAYAVAKIAGIKLCQAYCQQYGANFVCAIPATPFGPGDDFSPEDSHVIPALIRKMDEAKTCGAPSIGIWGTGSARREFIFAEDLADACLFLMNTYDDSQPINLGTGADLSIKELAEMIKDVVGYRGQLCFDPSKPDGMPVKVLDSSRLLNMGWQPKCNFKSSLKVTYDWFLENGDGNR
jgi:GDP-L-fucose synthase